MTQNILIIGLKPINSGKTSLAQAVISHLKQQQCKAVGFKPFSGSNIWYDFDMIDTTLSQSRIFSKDVMVLKQEARVDIDEEQLNPIHRIWNEPAIIDPITSLPSFILDRITLHTKSKKQYLLVINQNNVSQLNKKYFENLFKKPYEKQFISDVNTLNELTSTYYQKAIRDSYQKIKKIFDVVVVESYADNALLPWNGLDHFDVVLAITPGCIFSYDPIQYEKALQVSKQMYSWEVSTSKIAEMLKPIKKISLHPTTSHNVLPYLKSKIPKLFES
jgi:predicted P-loop ATPase/GTPase